MILWTEVMSPLLWKHMPTEQDVAAAANVALAFPSQAAAETYGFKTPTPSVLTTDYRLQITKWPHKWGARDGAKLGSMGISHHARLINMIIIIIRRIIST